MSSGVVSFQPPPLPKVPVLRARTKTPPLPPPPGGVPSNAPPTVTPSHAPPVASSDIHAAAVQPRRDRSWTGAPGVTFHDNDELQAAPRATSESPLIGQLIDRRYRIIDVIARGGMGVVYDAIHVGLVRRVAIKTLHARYVKDQVALQRFQNEAVVVGRIGHKNIVEVHDMGFLDDGSPYLVMERLEGETVTQRLQHERPLKIEFAIDIALGVLSALVKTHSLGILHRDLKPDNLYIIQTDDGPIVKVLDFGISKFVTQEMSKSQLTRNGFVMGTPSYMAPEQATGDSNLDARVDLYSLGVIMYEMLTGRVPYKAATPPALLAEMLRVTLMSVRMLRPEVHPDLDSIVMRAMHRDRDQRFNDALSMMRALEEARAASKLGVVAMRSLSPSQRPPPMVFEDPVEKRDSDSQQVELFDRGSILPQSAVPPPAPRVPKKS
jgi:serine/threonine-protein kinase